MGRALILSVVAMLVACSRPIPPLTVDGLAHDPQRLYALRHRCMTARAHVRLPACRIAQDAYRRRFFLGLGGPGEYQTLDVLPPIPASFDAPDDGAQP